jgi:hypothetical protein
MKALTGPVIQGTSKKIGSFPSAQELRRFDPKIKFETQLFTAIQNRIQCVSRLIAPGRAQGKEGMRAGHLVGPIEMAMPNEGGHPATARRST